MGFNPRSLTDQQLNYKMSRFAAFIAYLFVCGAMGANVENRGPRQYQQAQPQQQAFTADPRQGFGGQAELNFGQLGSVQGGANIGLPSTGSSLLTNAVIGLGALSLINTIATVVTPYLTKKDDATTDATTEKPAESRAMKALEDTVVESLLAAKKKYL